jgi:16S rRNA (guanine966-N2)-methyltransferase
MRIIAGEFRGRNLLSPEGDVTRPITDRVKQSLFDIIAPLIPDTAVYDCFAGTGSLGLECLSRGAAYVIFFEQDWEARSRLRQNIKALDVAPKSEIVGGDVFEWFQQARKPSRSVDLVFLDPPYRFVTDRPDDLRKLVDKLIEVHLSPSAIVMLRHDVKDTIDLPSLKKYDVRTYGGMTIDFLKRIVANC